MERHSKGGVSKNAKKMQAKYTTNVIEYLDREAQPESNSQHPSKKIGLCTTLHHNYQFTCYLMIYTRSSLKITATQTQGYKRPGLQPSYRD